MSDYFMPVMAGFERRTQMSLMRISRADEHELERVPAVEHGLSPLVSNGATA
jgi:hypothetical protein